MSTRGFKLGENVLVTYCDPLRIDVGVATLDVEPSDHFFNVFGHKKRVGFTWRLIGERAFFSDPIVLQVIPATFEDDRMYSAGVAVTRKHSRLTHTQQVNVITATGIEQKRLERN
ncbi:hypothetical protein BK634_13415 [Pseudomonas chlororaphis]|nr:hypothetical protein BK634_13415 [Pseudomonas chlororaphis]